MRSMMSAGGPWISIHAPVKGATKYDCGDGREHNISIHAPVKGATAVTVQVPAAVGISIHAPVKGATAAPRSLRYTL